MTNRSLGKWKLPQPIDLQENNEWVKYLEYLRTIPFGYEEDTEDNAILNPIPDQLDKLEMAKKYLKQYSYREVANWLTTNTGRSISHVGLRKRLEMNKEEKTKLEAYANGQTMRKRQSAKAKEIEESRIRSQRSSSTSKVIEN